MKFDVFLILIKEKVITYLLSDFMLSAQKPECKVQCVVGPGMARLLTRPMLFYGVPELFAPREAAGYPENLTGIRIVELLNHVFIFLILIGIVTSINII